MEPQVSASDDPTVTALKSALNRLGRASVTRVSPAALYDAWLLAETQATLALTAWRSAERCDKRAAYAVYLAALDIEADAANLLRDRVAEGVA
jgi:hypothetical protein